MLWFFSFVKLKGGEKANKKPDETRYELRRSDLKFAAIFTAVGCGMNPPNPYDKNNAFHVVPFIN
jgi:hypothetical protein